MRNLTSLTFLKSMTSDRKIITSPYRRGADFGLIFGLYLTLMFFSSIFATKLPMLGLLSFTLMVAVPVVIFLMIRRYDRELQECATFPMMWMLGVVTFVCGMLICSTFLAIYMKWIEPEFVLNQLKNLVEVGRQAPGTSLEEAADMAEQLIKANFIPSPMAIISELIMAAIVSGSILSILISSFFALRHKSARHRRERGME